MRRFAALTFLLLASVWSSQALATIGCEIQAALPSTVNVAAGGNTNFTVNVVDTGGCGSTVDLSFAVSGDTTGGATAPGPAAGAAIAPFVFNVGAGTTGGGTATVTVTCTAGCFNGPTTAVFTINTNNVYAFTPTSPTTFTTNQSTPYTLSTNFLVNGAGSGGDLFD